MPTENEKNDENVELQQVENYGEFLSIEDELHCYDENEDYDASIVARIAAKHMTASEDQESADDDPSQNMVSKPANEVEAIAKVQSESLITSQVGRQNVIEGE
ncbi:unnamed protein product [Calicophoron daubneyi]|uniref:Uncharacterized protein n=1 Tax=Calicophoron daubneyi TaxID=300641 RepID=A0AAV2TGL2_CALDB